MAIDTATRIQLLGEKLYHLSASQLDWVETIVNQFNVPHRYEIIDSDLFDTCMLESFGDALLIHHCMSKEPFSKDKFEYVLEVEIPKPLPLEATSGKLEMMLASPQRPKPGYCYVKDPLGKVPVVF